MPKSRQTPNGSGRKPSTSRCDLSELLGPQELAVMFGVMDATVYRWRSNNALPAPDVVLSGTAVWWRDTLMDWGRATGRLDDDGNVVVLKTSARST